MPDTPTQETTRQEHLQTKVKEIDPEKIKDALESLSSIWPEWKLSTSTYSKPPAENPEDFDLRKYTFESKFSKADQITLDVLPDENVVNIEVRDLVGTTGKRADFKGIRANNVSISGDSINFRHGEVFEDFSSLRLALGATRPFIHIVIKSKELGRSEFHLELKTGREITHRLSTQKGVPKSTGTKE